MDDVLNYRQLWPTPVKESSPRDIMLEAADRAHREKWAREWVFDTF